MTQQAQQQAEDRVNAHHIYDLIREAFDIQVAERTAHGDPYPVNSALFGMVAVLQVLIESLRNGSRSIEILESIVKQIREMESSNARPTRH